MDQQRMELFKLERTDMKALFWIMDHAPDAIQSWTEYIVEDYSRKKGIQIDDKRLYKEIVSADIERLPVDH